MIRALVRCNPRVLDSRRRRAGGTLRSWAMAFAIGVFLLGDPPTASAQAKRAPKDDRPRLVLNTEGPAGLVWKLAFSSDSRALFAAGADKTVHVWHLADAPPEARFVRTIRWPISRGNLGAIYDVDPSPTGEFLALGGYGGYEKINVAVVRLDRGEIFGEVFNDGGVQLSEQQLETALGATRSGGQPEPADAVAFSENGERLAAIDKRGRIMAWAIRSWRTGVTVRPPRESVSARTQVIRFLDDDRLAFAEPVEGGERISIVDLSAPQLRAVPVGPVHKDRVAAIARAPRGKGWASSDGVGGLYVWSGAPNARDLRIEEFAKNQKAGTARRVACSLAFSDDGNRLLAGNLPADHDMSKTDTTAEVWSLDRARKIATRTSVLVTSANPAVLHNPTVAWSRDGAWIATYHPQAGAIQLHRAKGNANVFADGPAVVIQGRSDAARHVAFENRAGGYRIGLSRAPAAVPERVFDSSVGRLYSRVADLPPAPPPAGWRNAESDAGDWKLSVTQQVRRDRTVADEVIVEGPGGRGTIALDRAGQGRYQSHCWIRDPQGNTGAVAIGTFEQNAIYVYSLPGTGGAAPQVRRYFRDHNGPVTSMCVTADGRYLASSSEDHSVKVWSLEGLWDDGARPVWGGDFQWEADGRVRIRRVLASGILAARGFQNGDVVGNVSGPDPGNPNVAKFWNLTTNETLASAVDRHRPWTTAEISATGVRGPMAAPREMKAIKIVPGWEPLLTLFAARNGQWAAFTPQGYFDATVIGDGPELFAWLISRGYGFTPRVLNAANLRKEFLRPDLIRGLLTAGDLPRAFEAVADVAPDDYWDAPTRIARQAPRISLIGPRFLEPVKPDANEILVSATVELGENDALADYEVKAFLDTLKLERTGEPIPIIAGKSYEIQWTASIKDKSGFNRVFVQLDGVDPGKTRFSATADGAVTTLHRSVDRPYPLHYFGVGVKNYSGGWQKLSFTDRDVTEFETELRELSQSNRAGFELKSSRTLLNADVTLQAFRKEVKAIEEAIENESSDPERLLIVHLSGHGTTSNNEYYFVTGASAGEADLEGKAIPWKMEFKPLMDLKCQKLFLIDTCRSGSIEELSDAIDPLKRSRCMYFAACGSTAESYEDADRKHGLFTYSLLQGMRGLSGFKVAVRFDDETSRRVLLGPLVRYTMEDVRLQAEQLFRVQEPVAYPQQDLLRAQRIMSKP